MFTAIKQCELSMTAINRIVRGVNANVEELDIYFDRSGRIVGSVGFGNWYEKEGKTWYPEGTVLVARGRKFSPIGKVDFEEASDGIDYAMEQLEFAQEYSDYDFAY
jgi:hypothetical protein